MDQMENYSQIVENESASNKYDYTVEGLVEFAADHLNVMNKVFKIGSLSEKKIISLLSYSIDRFAEKANDSGFKRTAESLCSSLHSLGNELSEEGIADTAEFETVENRIYRVINSFSEVNHGSN